MWCVLSKKSIVFATFNMLRSFYADNLFGFRRDKFPLQRIQTIILTSPQSQQIENTTAPSATPSVPVVSNRTNPEEEVESQSSPFETIKKRVTAVVRYFTGHFYESNICQLINRLICDYKVC